MYFTSPSSSSFALVGPSSAVEAMTQTSFFLSDEPPVDVVPGACSMSSSVPERTTAVERPPTGRKLSREKGLRTGSELETN